MPRPRFRRSSCRVAERSEGDDAVKDLFLQLPVLEIADGYCKSLIYTKGA
jgi:hypothetical protein